MSHTKRYYNKSNRIKDFYHPYKVLCCGHCSSCRDPMVSKRRRLTYKEMMRMELDELIEENKRLIAKYPDDFGLKINLQSLEEHKKDIS